MSYLVTTDDILSVPADAAVLGLEYTMRFAQGSAFSRLIEAGGEALQTEKQKIRFLPAGRAAVIGSGSLPYKGLLLVTIPRWLTGESNELQILRLCYDNLFKIAEEQGFQSLVTPFLSAAYFRFPLDEAVNIALTAAEKTALKLSFVAETPELERLGQSHYHRPEIVRYIGWYRDHGAFELDNGRFAKVDLRPEMRSVTIVPYIDPCYYIGVNPLQQPLPDEEIARLREIYETET